MDPTGLSDAGSDSGLEGDPNATSGPEPGDPGNAEEVSRRDAAPEAPSPPDDGAGGAGDPV
jgi:hypothetical protein